MEMWHWRAVMVAVLALIVCIPTLSSPLPSLSSAEKKEEISRLSIMSVSPQLGEEYMLFFSHFAAAIINWRETEPKEAAILDQWMILVSQNTPDEDEENPPIIVAVVNSNGEEGKIVVESDIAPDQIPAAAFVAAGKTIQLMIKFEREERMKKML